MRNKLLGNTHLPHYKKTADMKAITLPSPKEVLMPLSQHIGAPATPIVAIGDEVKVGQKIAEASGYVSSPIYASVSGKIAKIEDYLRPDGRIVPAIRVISDGLMTITDNITPPNVSDLDSLISASRESGLVGLGGAGFPIAVKLDAIKKGIIDTIIINAAECEPYITCDTHTMTFESEWVQKGIYLLEKYTGISKFIIGIEKNKSRCIKDMKKLFKSDDCVSVAALPVKYPQGGEKVLIYNTTQRIVPEGKLPADVGVIVINVTSLAILAKYIETGMPLVSRCLTFDGSAANEPKNVIVPIGTPIRDVIEMCGGVSESVGKVLYGGPMMGIPVATLDDPIVKTTGAITVLTREDSILPEPSACIRCGRCIRSCPLDLIPDSFSKALECENEDEKIAILEKNKIMLCMECGCCSYICPANRPLVQNNRLAKAEYRDYQARMSKLNK